MVFADWLHPSGVTITNAAQYEPQLIAFRRLYMLIKSFENKCRCMLKAQVYLLRKPRIAVGHLIVEAYNNVVAIGERFNLNADDIIRFVEE